MILELDAGNTFIKWRALDDQGQVAERGRVLTAELAGYHWPDLSLADIRVASVAGEQVNERLSRDLTESYGVLPCFARTAANQAGVTNSYEDPSRMGVDRWLVMLAAWQSCRRACCIVDCGSAITVEYLDDAGKHLGGYIMPGLRLLRSGLLKNTAEILVDRDVEGFETAPGTHTSAAVEQGINLMFTALQEKLVNELPADMPLYITGGDGRLFYQLAGRGEYRPELVMDGLCHALPDAGTANE